MAVLSFYSQIFDRRLRKFLQLQQARDWVKAAVLGDPPQFNVWPFFWTLEAQLMNLALAAGSTGLMGLAALGLVIGTVKGWVWMLTHLNLDHAYVEVIAYGLPLLALADSTLEVVLSRAALWGSTGGRRLPQLPGASAQYFGMFKLESGAVVTSAVGACLSLFFAYKLQVQAYESVVMFVLVVGGLAATNLGAAAGIFICLLGLPKLLLGPIIMTMVSTLMWTAAFCLQTLRSREDLSMEILAVLAVQVLDFDAKQSLRKQVLVSD